MRVEVAREAIRAIMKGKGENAVDLILDDVAKEIERKGSDVKVKALENKLSEQAMDIESLTMALSQATDLIKRLDDRIKELEGKVPEDASSSVERIKLEAKRVCQTCGKPIEGRGNKKFCDDCKKKRDKESKRTCTSKRKTFVDMIEEKEAQAREEAGEGLKELAKELASGIS